MDDMLWLEDDSTIVFYVDIVCTRVSAGIYIIKRMNKQDMPTICRRRSLQLICIMCILHTKYIKYSTKCNILCPCSQL